MEMDLDGQGLVLHVGLMTELFELQNDKNDKASFSISYSTLL